MSRRTSCLGLIAACCLPALAEARAQQLEVYELRPAVDLALIAGAASFSAAWALRNEADPSWCAPDCSPFASNVNTFDRLAAGNWNRDWSNAADAVVYAVMGGAALTLLIDGGGLPGAAEELVLLTQAIVLANALSALAQAAGDRPRPYMYSTEAPLEKRESGDGAMSFHSGHVATTFAAIIVTWDALRRRHPSGPTWIALATGLSMGAFVGVGRVLAGQHFPTDVMLSAVLGTATGVLVTQWHAIPAVNASEDGASIALAVRF